MNHPNPQLEPRLITYQSLRKAIGYMGIGLPAVLLLGIVTIGKCPSILDSISHYYYSIMGTFFTGTLFAVALFLIAYRGYTTEDNIFTNLAGGMALCIALFPTWNMAQKDCALFALPVNPLRSNVHMVAAGIFFSTLAYISIKLFTKTGGDMTPRKKSRNLVYRICGYTIVVCIAGVALTSSGLIPKLEKALAPYHPIFWFEWLGLWAFGISWLVKGEAVLKDEVIP